MKGAFSQNLNRRGRISFFLLALILLLCAFAEIIANDRPVVVQYQGTLYFPAWFEYMETEFGGEFEIAADFRDPLLESNIQERGWMLWPMVRFDYRSRNYDLPQPAPSPPSWQNPLGTDDQGRDVLARLIYGLRLSLLFAAIVTLSSAAIGVTAGVIQGFWGGWLDLVFQRIVEIWNALPSLYVLILLSSLVIPSFAWLALILVLFSWTQLVAVVRAEVLRVRAQDYILAAAALGVGNVRIMWRHVLPNALVATITYLPFLLSSALVTLTALDFLGLGLPPGSASLGELLAQGKRNLHAPWLGLTIFLSLTVVLSLLVFIGESLRDRYNPLHVSRHS